MEFELSFNHLTLILIKKKIYIFVNSIQQNIVEKSLNQVKLLKKIKYFENNAINLKKKIKKTKSS